ncbi:MAG: DNA-processing protein DprA [Pseudomonadota bacterium]
MQATDTPPPAARADSSLADWLRLEQAHGVGPVAAGALLAMYGQPHLVFEAGHDELRAALENIVSPALASAAARALCEPEPRARDELARLLEATEAWLAQPGQRRGVLTLHDISYPAQLRQIADAPPLLYTRGDAELLSRPSVAMVGSRNASAQGQANAERFAHALSVAGLTIVSGLALGIDAAAHGGGLLGPASTVAVIGTGIDRVYPARNRQLAEQIADQGCIVSEYALETPPKASNFPRRNRVISGLARGVLVVEAAAESGSLITAEYAVEQGREVFAIPGSIHATLSKGCHKLIKEGAKLVESAADVLDELHWPAAGQGKLRAEQAAALRGELEQLLAALGHDPAAPDVLALRTGLAPAAAQGHLLALELAGLVERLPGGIFQRLRR